MIRPCIQSVCVFVLCCVHQHDHAARLSFLRPSCRLGCVTSRAAGGNNDVMDIDCSISAGLSLSPSDSDFCRGMLSERSRVSGSCAQESQTWQGEAAMARPMSAGASAEGVAQVRVLPTCVTLAAGAAAFAIGAVLLWLLVEKLGNVCGALTMAGTALAAVYQAEWEADADADAALLEEEEEEEEERHRCPGTPCQEDSSDADAAAGCGEPPDGPRPPGDDQVHPELCRQAMEALELSAARGHAAPTEERLRSLRDRLARLAAEGEEYHPALGGEDVGADGAQREQERRSWSRGRLGAAPAPAGAAEQPTGGSSAFGGSASAGGAPAAAPAPAPAETEA
ncbi:unnamed protein product, partial [Prorocentrum cordatum]